MIVAAIAAALAGDGVGLTSLPFAELSVPRPAPPSADAPIRVDGPFRLVGVAGGVRSYEAPLPVRPRALFFESAPEGMTLQRGTATLRFAGGVDDAATPGTWRFTADALTIRVKAESPAPRAGEFVLTYPAAEDREKSLWRESADVKSDAEFVVRSAQVDDVTRHGLYLPAPSTAGWANVTIPPGATLRMQVGVLPAEIADGTTSDGADVSVRVDGTVVATVRAKLRAFTDVRVPLDAYAGRAVSLSLTTSDAAPSRDHVFVAAPTLYTPSATPKRTVLVFLDTMRRDHLGVYGYGRGASPKLDAWAKDAVVFDDARSVAPWTLPSTRSALSGLQPEAWGTARILPERLAARGWATAAYVGNVYLSSNFDMADGWGEHGCVNWPYGRLEVDRTIDFLDRHADQDAMVMVHFMDMHLPYKEPSAYRGLYEGDTPEGLHEGFNRNTLLAASKKSRDTIKKYLVGRYDQNLRYVDDQLARLFAAVGDDATVVVFADHGEEFFDHGDLEHGHTLYDELLRIPLLVKAPGLAPRRVDTPVSLLDLTPTVLDLLGLGDPGLAGKSLVGLARGEADPALVARPLAFGRPLYGNEAWGSLADGVKYVSKAGKELLFDVRTDASELSDLRPEREPDAAREAMARGLGRGVAVAYRLAPKGRGNTPFNVEMCVPGGIAEAWVGDDPIAKSEATLTRIDPERLTARFTSARGWHREVFVVPLLDAESLAPSVTVRVAKGQRSSPPDWLEPKRLAATLFDGVGDTLARLSSGGRTLEVTYAAVPLPVDGKVVGIDSEHAAALEALGYLDGEDSEPSGASEAASGGSARLGASDAIPLSESRCEGVVVP